MFFFRKERLAQIKKKHTDFRQAFSLLIPEVPRQFTYLVTVFKNAYQYISDFA